MVSHQPPEGAKDEKTMRKTKLEDLNLSTNAQRLIRDVEKTRNLPTLARCVKAAIAARAGEEAPEFNFDKIGEKKVRSRAQRLCAAIGKLEDPKTLSVLCASAISAHKACRAKADD